jgi:DNA-directed RNA polymerase specialized sigma subunit
MKDVNKLIQDHKRLIESEAAKYSQFVPSSVVQAEAYRIARKAADSYDPKSGNQFSTHLTNQLKKLSRISTTYGNIARLPEKRQFELTRLNHAEQSLKDELGREPSVEELSTATGFGLHTVKHLLTNRKKEVNIENLAYTPVFIDNNNDEWIHFVYQDLPPRDKTIFEHKIGWAGKQELSNEELAKKLGISPSTVNNRVRMISAKLAEGWREHGT